MKKFLYVIVCIGMLLGLSPVFIGTTAKATANGIDPSSYTFDAVEVGYSSIAQKNMDLYFNFVQGKTSAELTGANPDAFILDCTLPDEYTDSVSGRKTFSIKPQDGLSAGTYSTTIKLTIGNQSYTSDVSFTVHKIFANNLKLKYNINSSALTSQAEQSFSENTSLEVAVDGAYFAPSNPDPIQIYATIDDGKQFIISSIETVSANNTYTSLIFNKDDLNSLKNAFYNITVTFIENQYNESKVTTQQSLYLYIHPSYSISLTPSTDIEFNSAVIGYGTQSPYSVTINSTGTGATGDLAVSLSGTNADGFILSKIAIPSITAADSDTFTVVPKTGLAIGTYVAVVNVAKGQGNPNDLAAKQINISFTVTAADKPSKQDDLFLVTFLDSKGNTVKVEWVKYGGNATAPTGYGAYSGYTNVTAHMDLKPIGTASTNNGYNVPNTADKKASE